MPPLAEIKPGINPDASDATTIMRSDLPQIPLDEWDSAPAVVVGRIFGPPRDYGTFPIQKGNDSAMLFCVTKATQFVRVILLDGTEVMQRYNPDIHGEWEDIPEIGGTLPELEAQLEGFGDDKIPHGQQFRRVRKAPGGASRVQWPAGHFPSPRKPKISPR
jgi:hypothetical protein